MGKILCAGLTVALALAGCAGNKSSEAKASESAQAPAAPAIPAPDADSLYAFVGEQVALGPRVPGSEAAARCASLFERRLAAFGADTVITHEAPVTFHNGSRAIARNILGRFNPEARKRVLLLAHYDSRPWADQDPDPANHAKPIDGANDGASGAAVLLEIARMLGTQAPDSLGVDLLFVDAEDSGYSGYGDEDSELSWCLGTQAWIKEMPYTPADRPRFAILLDMVGGRDARFHREYFSDRLARGVVDKVWAAAARAGLAARFPNSRGGSVVDDHIHINSAGIPCADIIESANPETGSFNPTWHTMADNLSNIDRETLRAVTRVVAEVLYKE